MNKRRNNIINLLAHAVPFKGLDRDRLALVAQHTAAVEAKRETEIVAPGSSADGAYFLVFGQVVIALPPKGGAERTVAILEDGACFGLAEMLAAEPHSAGVKASADSLILCVARAPIFALLEESPAFSRELASCVSRQFCALMRTLERQTQSARQRLAGYFLRQRQIRNCDDFALPCSRETISALLWLTPETVSRVLHDFALEGMIRVSGRKVQILNSAQLAEVLAGGI
ncbi:MAG TPA: Crp/Fnr family transcriptional regulator [Burkholderiaceae bacterium]